MFTVKKNLKSNFVKFKNSLLRLHKSGISAPVPPVPGSVVSNFSVTTTSGNITIAWGDGSSNAINSGSSINYQYFCPNSSALGGFWNNIEPC